jgi:hypothetical protein
MLDVYMLSSITHRASYELMYMSVKPKQFSGGMQQ